MNRDVIITCAVTGAADTVDKHPNIPVTPQQIADAAIEPYFARSWIGSATAIRTRSST